MRARYLLPVLALAALAGCGNNENSAGTGGASTAATSGPATSASSGSPAGGKKWTIGFSQVTEAEPWRAVFDKHGLMRASDGGSATLSACHVRSAVISSSRVP